MKEYKELSDEELEKATGGEKTESEYIEEMITDLQTLLYLTPTTIAQLRKAGFANVYCIVLRCSYHQKHDDLFDQFIDACKKFGNIDCTGCYVLK